MRRLDILPQLISENEKLMAEIQDEIDLLDYNIKQFELRMASEIYNEYELIDDKKKKKFANETEREYALETRKKSDENYTSLTNSKFNKMLELRAIKNTHELLDRKFKAARSMAEMIGGN